jgi:hypothetical protein
MSVVLKALCKTVWGGLLAAAELPLIGRNELEVMGKREQSSRIPKEGRCDL